MMKSKQIPLNRQMNSSASLQILSSLQNENRIQQRRQIPISAQTENNSNTDIRKLDSFENITTLPILNLVRPQPSPSPLPDPLKYQQICQNSKELLLQITNFTYSILPFLPGQTLTQLNRLQVTIQEHIARLDLFTACQSCKNVDYELGLSCGCLICKSCAYQALCESTDYFLVPSKQEEEQMIYAECPLYHKLGEADIKSILGDQYEMALQEAAQRNTIQLRQPRTKQRCKNCGEDRVSREMIYDPCQQTCERCIGKLFGCNFKRCKICKQKFLFADTIRRKKVRCNECGNGVSLINAYNRQFCKKHLYCKKCGVNCLTKGKCKACNKELSDSQVFQAEKKYVFVCALDEGQHYLTELVGNKCCLTLICVNCQSFNKRECVKCYGVLRGKIAAKIKRWRKKSMSIQLCKSSFQYQSNNF